MGSGIAASANELQPRRLTQAEVKTLKKYNIMKLYDDLVTRFAEPFEGSIVLGERQRTAGAYDYALAMAIDERGDLDTLGCGLSLIVPGVSLTVGYEKSRASHRIVMPASSWGLRSSSRRAATPQDVVAYLSSLTEESKELNLPPSLTLPRFVLNRVIDFYHGGFKAHPMSENTFYGSFRAAGYSAEVLIDAIKKTYAIWTQVAVKTHPDEDDERYFDNVDPDLQRSRGMLTSDSISYFRLNIIKKLAKGEKKDLFSALFRIVTVDVAGSHLRRPWNAQDDMTFPSLSSVLYDLQDLASASNIAERPLSEPAVGRSRARSRSPSRSPRDDSAARKIRERTPLPRRSRSRSPVASLSHRQQYIYGIRPIVKF